MKTITNSSPEAFCLEIVRKILLGITLHPKELKIHDSALGRSHTIMIQVHRGDMPRVIGAKGAHTAAIKKLVEFIGRRNSIPITIRMREPEVGEKDFYSKFEPKNNWESADLVELAREIAEGIFEYDVDVQLFDGEDYQSAIEISVSPRENKELVKEVEQSMQPLFVAMGKSRGRLLMLNIIPSKNF